MVLDILTTLETCQINLVGYGFAKYTSSLKLTALLLVLFYTLRGKLSQEGDGFKCVFDKIYESAKISSDLRVRYSGALKQGPGKYALS